MEILQIFDKVVFFRELSEAEKEALGKIHLRIFKFDAKVPIIRERELQTSLFVMIRGTATVINAKQEPLAILKPGDVFGEMAFLGGLPRTASVVANNEVIVMRMDKEPFQTLEPALREKLKDSLFHLVLERLFPRVADARLDRSFDWARDE